jgi:hypothetical protein
MTLPSEVLPSRMRACLATLMAFLNWLTELLASCERISRTVLFSASPPQRVLPWVLDMKRPAGRWGGGGGGSRWVVRFGQASLGVPSRLLRWALLVWVWVRGQRAGVHPRARQHGQRGLRRAPAAPPTCAVAAQGIRQLCVRGVVLPGFEVPRDHRQQAALRVECRTAGLCAAGQGRLVHVPAARPGLPWLGGLAGPVTSHPAVGLGPPAGAAWDPGAAVRWEAPDRAPWPRAGCGQGSSGQLCAPVAPACDQEC